MTDPSTPVPSDEAVEALAKRRWESAQIGFVKDPWDDAVAAMKDDLRVLARRELTAAYAIDAPRIAAEAAAEARAATLREVEAWLRSHGGHAAARDLTAHFNPEAG